MQGWKLALCLLFAGCFLFVLFIPSALGQSEINILPFKEKIEKETIDPERYPSREAYAVGEKLAREAMSSFRAEKGSYPPRVAAVIWGKETAGREGPMVSFALALLGVKPRWDLSGKVVGLEPVSLHELGRPRIDVITVTTGLFRDLFRNQIILLDRAYRLALAASYQSIITDYPELRGALDSSLAPLEKAGLLVKRGEPLESNHVARYWIISVRELMAGGCRPEEAGELALARIFAPPEGEFGSGVNVAGSPEDAEKVADLFVKRVGNVYSEKGWGVNQPELLKKLLKGCNLLFHCSSEGPILDQDDLPLEYTYVPGLKAALEKWAGKGVEKITGTISGLEGGGIDGEPGQREDSPVRLSEKGDGSKVREKPQGEENNNRRSVPTAGTKVLERLPGEEKEPVKAGPRHHQASSAASEPGTEPGPRIFEIETVTLPPARSSREQASCWPAVGFFLALLVVGGVKGFLWHRREFIRVVPD